jgi:17beta-estradiol 17-dehydrogenase / very-long-chain 3-oxoacyl-CoA reductase
MSYEQALQLLGILLLVYYCYKICSFIWLYVRPSSLHRYLKDSESQKENNWAFLTGASDGIGKAFAHDLCRRGFNVVLHGRNPTKLERVQKELNQKYPSSKTKIVVADANLTPTSSLEQVIIPKIEDLKLSILINNVGGTAGVQSPTETYSTIDEHSFEAVDGLININARFSTQLTRLLVPLLCKRPRSLIMNISSGAEWGMPYLSVYSGTKAYITAWSRALTAEMQAEKRNVEVLGIVVGSVQTDSNSYPLSIFHPPVERFARATLNRVGCGKASVYGYMPHALQAMTLDYLPESAVRNLIIKTIVGRRMDNAAAAKKA